MLSKRSRRNTIIQFWQRFNHDPINLIGLFGTLFLIILAIYPNWIVVNQDSFGTFPALLPPIWSANGDFSHLLGTDQYGNDFLTLLIRGGRNSFGLSLILALLLTMLSVTLSLWLSFTKNMLSTLIVFLLRCISTIPSLLMGIILAILLGASLIHAALAISIVVFPIGVFHISQKLQSEKSQDYILAAYLDGATHRYIILNLLLPNSMQYIIEEFISLFSIILLEMSVLAFFGLSGSMALWQWGGLLREGIQLTQHSILYLLCPGLALIFSLLCLQLLGKGIINTIKIQDD